MALFPTKRRAVQVHGLIVFCRLAGKGGLNCHAGIHSGGSPPCPAAFRSPQVETIGSLFIVAGGLLREEEDGAVAVRDRWDPLHAEKVR